MKNFVLVANSTKDNSEECANKIIEIIERNGCRCTACLFAQENADPAAGFLYTDPALVPEDTEAILSLGGDGTFIHASKDRSACTFLCSGSTSEPLDILPRWM